MRSCTWWGGSEPGPPRLPPGAGLVLLRALSAQPRVCLVSLQGFETLTFKLAQKKKQRKDAYCLVVCTLLLLSASTTENIQFFSIKPWITSSENMHFG